MKKHGDNWRLVAQITRAFLVIVFWSTGQLFARESLEIGVERFQPIAPVANANFTSVLLNYHFDRNFYLGTSQSALYLRGDSDYRPDFHIGFILPILDFFSFEAAIGVDFYSALIIALAIADEDSNIDYKFTSNFYAPYLNLMTGVRFEFDRFALKVMLQSQLGGYLRTESNAFNASLWLGLGATVRFEM